MSPACRNSLDCELSFPQRWLASRAPKEEEVKLPKVVRAKRKYEMASVRHKFLHGQGAICSAFTPDATFFATGCRDVRVSGRVI